MEKEKIEITIERFKKGPVTWNQWRERNPDVQVDLSGADLRKIKFYKIYESNSIIFASLSSEERIKQEPGRRIYNLKNVNLNGADFSGSYFHYLAHFDLGEADFSNVSLRKCKGLNVLSNDMMDSIFSIKVDNLKLSDLESARIYFGDIIKIKHDLGIMADEVAKLNTAVAAIKGEGLGLGADIKLLNSDFGLTEKQERILADYFLRESEGPGRGR